MPNFWPKKCLLWRCMLSQCMSPAYPLSWDGNADSQHQTRYLLVVVIARTQHHPVLAEGDRLIIVICRQSAFPAVGMRCEGKSRSRR